jgi:hypothetical protein
VVDNAGGLFVLVSELQVRQQRGGESRCRPGDVAFPPIRAHSETLSASCRMLVRSRMQVLADELRIGHARCCSTPDAVTLARLFLPGESSSLSCDPARPSSCCRIAWMGEARARGHVGDIIR